MKITKAQLTYFLKRVESIRQRVVGQVQSTFPIPKSLSPEEKLDMVASGAAHLRYDEIKGKIMCRTAYSIGDLFQAFVFPGDEQRKEESKAAEADMAKAVRAVYRYTERLCDELALGRIEDVEAALAAFENSADSFIAGRLEP